MKALIMRVYLIVLRDLLARDVMKYLLTIPVQGLKDPTSPQLCNTAYFWADQMMIARRKP